MQRRAVGPEAWLVDDVAEPAAWAASLRALALGGVREIVPAERTVLVVCDRTAWDTVGHVSTPSRSRQRTERPHRIT